VELLVVADDRTGAMETAGAIAEDRHEPVPVVPYGRPVPRGEVAVVDLGTRHRIEEAVEDRCAWADGVTAARHAHKIDSTLRGGWAAELAARARRRPVLVVPALPALGRMCAGGVVLVDGRPVHEAASGRDVGRTVASSRPADHLRAAGVDVVDELRDVRALDGWLAGAARSRVAVCDAATAGDLDAIGARWSASAEVLLAGTSATIAAGARHTTPISWSEPAVGGVFARPELVAPVVVVRGSAHPAAVEQCARLIAAGAASWTGRPEPGAPVLVLEPGPAPGPLERLDLGVAAAVAGELGAVARSLVAPRGPASTLVVLGGDTAAAVLGDDVVLVGGVLAPGTAWGRLAATDVLVVARSGGFGGPDALVELLSATLAP
jgi:4-hydroxythreonine-4-phosphate dehydrogenase